MRQDAQALDRSAHGQQRGLQDVQAVDLFHAGTGDAAAQGARSDLVKEQFTPAWAEHLAVGQAGYRGELVQDHRSGHHRAGQGAPPRFVHPSHQARHVKAQAQLLRLG